MMCSAGTGELHVVHPWRMREDPSDDTGTFTFSA